MLVRAISWCEVLLTVIILSNKWQTMRRGHLPVNSKKILSNLFTSSKLVRHHQIGSTFASCRILFSSSVCCFLLQVLKSPLHFREYPYRTEIFLLKSSFEAFSTEERYTVFILLRVLLIRLVNHKKHAVCTLYFWQRNKKYFFK